MDSNNAVTLTVQTYEQSAEDYSNAHSDIREVKCYIDLFITSLKGKKVLDIGCGPGRDAKYFSDHNLEVTGVDLTQKFLQLAAKNAPHASFLQADMRELKLPEKSFDGIWACASLLHIPKADVYSTLVGFNRLLKQNGLMYIDVEKGTQEKILKKEEYKNRARFIAFYTEDEIKNLVISSGFSILRMVVDENKYGWIRIFAIKQKYIL